ncbi:MAG: rRNA maturation RNase YbeY [Candidatus Omnitrophica bacterium]|nr:rRNA maturation RNase YbeY [Candidatus Omnitrophota bacterium]
MALKFDNAWAQKIIAATLRAEKAGGWSIGVNLVNDRQIRAINKRYLNHDYATDVIAFGYGDKLGDIVVSKDTARRMAGELKIAYKEELARYIVHGTLHLLGYDDRKESDRKRMHERQERFLGRLRRPRNDRMPFEMTQ